MGVCVFRGRGSGGFGEKGSGGSGWLCRVW